ncbi:MAG: glycosyltransferase [candidate division WWE3 bacterium]|nr:glycosyltransferase [candidate division WWE3 bacterium]
MISACLVIYNEETLLPRCLESLQGVIDEIVIVHDGPCSDKSIQIAKTYGAKIFIKEHVGEAEYHRPFCFSEAHGDWILHIDADEYLSGDLRQSIPELITNDKIDSFAFGWPITVNGHYVENGYFSKEPRPSLFRTSKMYMLGLTHEHPRTYGVTTIRNDLLLEHRPLESRSGYSFKNFWGEGFKRAKLRACQLRTLSRLPEFNITDPKTNPTFKYYQQRLNWKLFYLFYDPLRLLSSYVMKGVFFAGNDSARIALYRLGMTILNYYCLFR